MNKPKMAGLIAAGVAGLAGAAVALTKLFRLTHSLHTEKLRLEDGTPVTIFHPREHRGAPVVVIAHGFAASRQIMFPFAVTLARNGYIAVTFDFPAHGQNTRPMTGNLSDSEEPYQILRSSLDQVVNYVSSRFNREVVLLGHSMGSATVTRYAQETPQFPAVVAVSLVYEKVTPQSPRNLLVINGGLEVGLRKIAQGVIDPLAGGQGRVGVTYGSTQDGTARRVAYAPGVEHIGVLFSHTSLREALAWFDECLNRSSPEPVFLDNRLRWMGGLFAATALLFIPFAELFRAYRNRAEGAQHTSPLLPTTATYAPLPRKMWAALALLPALATPLIMRLLPPEPVNRLLPILVGGPTSLFFSIYGLLTAAGLAIAHRQQQGNYAIHPAPLPTLKQTMSMVALITSYVHLTQGLPTHRFLLNYFPATRRLPITAAIFAMLLPYFIADELLTHHPMAPRGAYALTKTSFLGSLALLIALNPYRFFFLVLAAPVFLGYFGLYGTFSGMVYRRYGSPLPAAVANAAIFATSFGAAFPLVESQEG
jgi:pimeloyl-ACP methyl ester carboxylesterase